MLEWNKSLNKTDFSNQTHKMKGFQSNVVVFFKRKKRKWLWKNSLDMTDWTVMKSEDVWFYFFDHQFCQVATAQGFPSVWGHSLDGCHHLVMNHDVVVASRSTKLLPEHPCESVAAFLLPSQTTRKLLKLVEFNSQKHQGVKLSKMDELRF